MRHTICSIRYASRIPATLDLQSNKRINSLLASVIAQANAAHNPAIIPTALTKINITQFIRYSEKLNYFS